MNPANNGNQAAAALANTFQQNGQAYKKVGNFPAPLNNNNNNYPSGQNVVHFNQPKPQIDTNIGSPIGGAKGIRESQKNEIHDSNDAGGHVLDSALKVVKDSDANKPQKFDTQVGGNHGSLNQKVLDLQGTDLKPNNDSKSVFVINKNRFNNSENSVKINEQRNELTDQRNKGISVNDRINEIKRRLDGKEPDMSNNEMIQEKKMIDSDVRYPLKGDLARGSIGANQEPVDISNKQPIGANSNNNNNNNLPVDPKLNEAFKDLAQNSEGGLPININVIDGEVEKNKSVNEGAMVSDDYNDDDNDQEDEGAAVRRSDIEPEKKDALPNEIPRDLGGAIEVNNPNRQDNQNHYNGQQRPQGNYWQGKNDGQQNNVINGQQFNNPQQFNNIPQINVAQQGNFGQQNNNGENKEGSLKVVWDWSDFAVNFEQYIAPEQKIRRAPHATTGEPWPLPQYYITKQDVVYRIDKGVFHFKLSKVKCDIIEKAIERYRSYILEDSVEEMYDNFQHAQSTLFEDPTLKYETATYTEAPIQSFVSVKIRKPCAKLPSEKMDESCKLVTSLNFGIVCL